MFGALIETVEYTAVITRPLLVLIARAKRYRETFNTDAVDDPLLCLLIVVIWAVVFTEPLWTIYTREALVANARPIHTLAMLRAVWWLLLIYRVYVNIDERIITISELTVLAIIPIVACTPAHDTRALERTIVDARCCRQIVNNRAKVNAADVLRKRWVDPHI